MSQTKALWQSECVYYGSDGKLEYASDEEQNRIPDYSYAGYRYGAKEPPEVPEVSSIGPVSGDNTEHIQNALDEVGASEPDANGFRGALVLEPGEYEIHGTLYINKSGVVLRGSGDGKNPDRDTILVAKGSPERTVVILGTNKPKPWDRGDKTQIVDDFVQVGSLSFDVEDASLFNAKDRIIIHHPSTQQWLNAIDGGGLVNENERWKPGSTDIVYYRRVVRVEGSTIYLDAPIYNHLNRKLSQSSAYTVASSKVVTRVGLESLRIDVQAKPREDKSAVGIIGAEDSWVRNITVVSFAKWGVYTMGALRVTVMDTKSLDPLGVKDDGGFMYNFNTQPHSQLILFKNCEARKGRHNYISNGTSSASGIVFYRCKSQEDSDYSEGHRYWTQAMLFDNIEQIGSRGVRLINRGDFGSSHGWAAAHSTIWNYNGEMCVQKPPTAQNYAVSSQGRERKPWHPGPRGFVEINEGELSPASLYEAQLRERLQP